MGPTTHLWPPGATPATTNAFHSGLNLLRRLYMTVERYSNTLAGPTAWPSSSDRSSVLQRARDRPTVPARAAVSPGRQRETRQCETYTRCRSSS